MKKIEVYKFSELPEEIQEKIIERERKERENDDYIPWAEETLESLKKLFKIAGVPLKKYSLGLYGSDIRADLGDANDLTGARAIAWLENNLFSKLRMTRARYLARRADNFKYGYRVDFIPDCPLTGYCADHDYLEDLRKSVLSGRTLKESFQDLAHVYERLIQSEYDNYLSESEIVDQINCYDADYTIDGTQV